MTSRPLRARLFLGWRRSSGITNTLQPRTTPSRWLMSTAHCQSSSCVGDVAHLRNAGVVDPRPPSMPFPFALQPIRSVCSFLTGDRRSARGCAAEMYAISISAPGTAFEPSEIADDARQPACAWRSASARLRPEAPPVMKMRFLPICTSPVHPRDHRPAVHFVRHRLARSSARSRRPASGCRHDAGTAVDLDRRSTTACSMPGDHLIKTSGLASPASPRARVDLPRRMQREQLRSVDRDAGIGDVRSRLPPSCRCSRRSRSRDGS